ncbi:hypothetical protein [Deinococcus sp.]|uniref:hypothetical protein n=1 Tax=Deinococcus sp. TaxID=47478 RepID=UPI0025EE56F9|nr:hypothetical protein [Deinococcus sp.]
MDLQHALDAANSARALSLFLFAVFTAWWAQEHRRVAWVWFLGGLFFGPFCGLYLLYLNAQERSGGGLP